MITYQIGCETDFWVESCTQVRRILGAMKVLMDELRALGYVSDSAGVCGGVTERDTGYAEFRKQYAGFDEMEARLCDDFASQEARLDGFWFNTLNFESMSVSFRKGPRSGILSYCRGILTLHCGADEETVRDRCSRKIVPYLYK